MKKTIVLALLMLSFVVLQSFQSCREELVTISFENNTQDTVFCAIRDTDYYIPGKGNCIDIFEGIRSSFEWRKLAPKETNVLWSVYYDDEESASWKVWCVKNSDMADMSLEEVIDKGLLDSLCSLKKVYTYDDMKSLNFCIRFY